MTAAALLVGIELGIQPLLFTTRTAWPLYSPYGLTAAVPAMLVAHVFGASIVEGLIGALGVAYFQKRHPEYLTSLRAVFATEDAPEGEASSAAAVAAARRDPARRGRRGRASSD